VIGQIAAGIGARQDVTREPASDAGIYPENSIRGQFAGISDGTF
jgi:hypothetical protein